MAAVIRVLYVDDERDLLELGKLYLEQSVDFTVTTITNAPEAIRVLEQEKFDAIISDYQMPGMDGIQFLVEVRTRFGPIPFILFTGRGREEVVIQAINNGADFYLQKGGEPSAQFAELSHKVKSAASRKRAGDALLKKTEDLHSAYEELTASKEDIDKSEHKYRRLFQMAQDAILILDWDTGQVIDANTFILTMLGYPLEYFVGKHLWELGFIKDKALAQQAFTELKTNGYIRYEDLPLETKGGQSFHVEFISNVYTVDDKKIIQCNIRDITDRKVVQEALQASETRYRRLFETAQDGILILDEGTGKILDANTFILTMLGYPLEYFVGKHLWELGFIKDKALAQQAFTELKTNSYIRYEDLPLETKDGQSFHVEFISNVYPVNHHKIIQCNIRDITTRKRAEELLAIASKKLALLSGITRHDILNQLTMLQGYLSLLEMKQLDPTLNEFLHKVTTAAERISSMIQFTKEYEGVGVNIPVWQDCRTLVDTAAREAPLGQVTVKNDLPIGTEVFADSLIVKVFYNLMDNAVRYGGKITTIRFSLQESGDDYLIVCEDDGVGIPADEKEKIFERGFGKNTGLGLALSREILDITGITIQETGEPGKGARFEITLPKGVWRMGEQGA